MKTDRDISQAIGAAGGRPVIIPAGDYEIAETIVLPSDTTLILDGCHLRMQDGVVCRMFQNAGAEGHNIHIEGRGGAVLDGGLPNGLDEFTSCKDGHPHVSENLVIFFDNVSDFSVTGLTIRDQRWWAMAFMFCERGRIENIRFELTRHQLDSYARWRNQDGIDLRVGCSDMIIRNITGETGDDMIALTALRSPFFEQRYTHPGRSLAIHHVLIENVRGVTNQCALIRLLSHFGQQIHDIVIRNVEETGVPGKTNQTQMAIRIGDRIPPYYRRDEANAQQFGDIHDIRIENLTTRALTAIVTADSVKDVFVKGVHLVGDGQSVWCSGGWLINLQPFIYLPEREAEVRGSTLTINVNNPVIAENVRIEDVVCTAQPNQPVPLFRFNRTEFRHCAITGLQAPGRALVEAKGCEGAPAIAGRASH
ncbi:MAG: glycosyl hydrolase family 28 protein [Lentisphaeria bacterium]|nr:glycosyl hydrolase family 28 protein [Lentisphaeria bacterium]